MTSAFRSGLATCDHYIEVLYDSVRVTLPPGMPSL